MAEVRAFLGVGAQRTTEGAYAARAGRPERRSTHAV